jgi:hypothetical protein
MAALGGQAWLYGGASAGQGDVWRLLAPEACSSRDQQQQPRQPDARQGGSCRSEWQWERVLAEQPAPQGPGRRVGAPLLPLLHWRGHDQHALLLLGGRLADVGGYVLASDAWVLQGSGWQLLRAATTWQQLEGLPADAPSNQQHQQLQQPPARYQHAAAVLDEDSRAAAARLLPPAVAARLLAGRLHAGVMSGGSSTCPAMTCLQDSWLWLVDAASGVIGWLRLEDHPFGVYDHVTAAHGGFAYNFGGHLCRGPGRDMAAQPFDYSNALTRLDLRQAGAAWRDSPAGQGLQEL